MPENGARIRLFDNRAINGTAEICFGQTPGYFRVRLDDPSQGRDKYERIYGVIVHEADRGRTWQTMPGSELPAEPIREDGSLRFSPGSAQEAGLTPC